MKVVIAMDSFKGSLSSMEAGNAVRAGLLRAVPDAEVLVLPLADGGEGTTDALVAVLDGRRVDLEVSGPYGDTVKAQYGWLPDRNLAVMEMASASGLTLSPRREPLKASSAGVGQMIRHAVGLGCRDFIIGIGGSATNDGGIGMLSELGYRFLDEEDRDCGVTAKALGRIARIDRERVMPELSECHFRIACDVTNPLCGETGCTYIFGPQKGVTEEMRESLDADMSHFADVTAELGEDLRNVPGAGAAGGLGFAFLAYLHGELRRGIELVLDALHMEDHLRDADLVVTGEGCLDSQTMFGKAPAGVAECANRCKVPVIAFAGGIRPGAELCNERGIRAYFATVPGVVTPEEAMEPSAAMRNLELTAEQVFRLAGLWRDERITI